MSYSSNSSNDEDHAMIRLAINRFVIFIFSHIPILRDTYLEKVEGKPIDEDGHESAIPYYWKWKDE